MGAICWTGAPPQALPKKHTNDVKIQTQMRLNEPCSTVVPFPPALSSKCKKKLTNLEKIPVGVGLELAVLRRAVGVTI